MVYDRRSHKIKKTQNTRMVSIVGEEALAYLLVGGKTVAVTQESGEVH